MGQGMSRKRQRMTHERGNAASTFDTLYPELLDLIVDKVAEVDPEIRKRLARLNKSFQEAAWRCEQTLVIRKTELKPASRAEHHGSCACAALSKDIRLRPKLSRLVLESDAKVARFWPALSKVQWTKLESGIKKQDFGKFLRLLRKSRFSLKHLEIGDDFVHEKALDFILQAFPKLETLVFLGSFNCLGSFGGQLLRGNAFSHSLTKLDVGSSPFVDLNQAFQLLPARASLPKLSSLRLSCCGTGPKYRVHRRLSLETFADSILQQIQTLRVDVCDEYSCDVLLQQVAQHCPSLRILTLQTSPKNTRSFARGSYSPFRHIEALEILKSCRDLEKVTISRLAVVSEGLIRLLASIYAIGCFTVNVHELEEKILVLKDRCESVSSTSKICYSSFSCYIPLDAPAVLWDDPETPQRALGEAGAVQSWCQAFCGVDP